MAEAKAIPTGDYLTRSRTPLASLVFVLPLIVIYEVGTALLLTEATPLGVAERRVVAFNWTRDALATFGAGGRLVAPAATIALLLGWHVFSHHPWRLRPGTVAGMAVESVLLALPFFLIARLTGWLLGLPNVFLLAGLSPGQEAVLGVGAGVYEELIFRLVGFAVLHLLLNDVLKIRRPWDWVVTLAVTSVAFSLYHYLGAEPFALSSFTFRTLAGVYLGLVFLYRGFGVAAGTHAAYDVILALT